MAYKKKQKRLKVSRTGKVQCGAWIDKEVYKQLKHISVENETNVGIELENAVGEYVERYKSKFKEGQQVYMHILDNFVIAIQSNLFKGHVSKKTCQQVF